MARVDIAPDVLRWARERSSVAIEQMVRKFPRYESWESGEGGPTFNQLPDLANFLHVSMGLLFLPAPIDENLPLPDFRRIDPNQQQRPSPELLDTIMECQRRQTWYQVHVRQDGAGPLRFVGSATTADDPVAIAGRIRTVLELEVGERSVAASWVDFLRVFIRAVQDAGVLVMVNGVVGNNTRRKLDPREFRGFAIADALAPLIFINGADAKAAQIFTLAHEVAHVWLGQSGVSKVQPDTIQIDNEVEFWCNKVAAEVLVPMAQLQSMDLTGEISERMIRIARMFRVSTLVALRRLLEAGTITASAFRSAYDEELKRILAQDNQREPGGNFYNTMNARVDRNFAAAVISSTIEGRTLIGEAMNLLNVQNTKTLKREAIELGFSL